MLWNSKSKINRAAGESAKPQKSLTLARNAQRSGCSTSIYSLPAPFTALLYCLSLCLLMFLCFLSIIFSSVYVDTIFFICTCFSASSSFLVSLLYDPNLGRWFSTLEVGFWAEWTDGSSSRKLSYKRGQTLHHIDDDRQMAGAVNVVVGGRMLWSFVLSFWIWLQE